MNSNIDPEKVGLFLRKLRIEKKISQQVLADNLYLTRQSVSLWELGKTLPDYDSAVLLANYFNISIGELFAGKRITDKKELNRATANVIRIELRRSQKRLIDLIIAIILFIIIFLSYYFINSYNSIKIYSIDYYGSDNEIRGYLTKSVNDIYMNFEIDSIYENICLKYKDDNKDINLICKSNTNALYLRETLGYNELLDIKSFDDFINNLYVYTEDKGINNTYKLMINVLYKNNALIFNDNENIIQDNNVVAKVDVPKYIRENFEYDENDKIYSYKYKFKTIDSYMYYYVVENRFVIKEFSKKTLNILEYNNVNKKIISYYSVDNSNNETIFSLYNYPDFSKTEELMNIYNYYNKNYIQKYLQ